MGSGQIRLLRLCGVYDSGKDITLSGDLEVVRLKQPKVRRPAKSTDYSSRNSPKFSALSYVWGPPSETHIPYNEIRINITDNCYDALSSLWRLYEPLLIWVDAICINQSDEKEKSAQIGLMHDIYSLAQPVYIWLGRKVGDSDKAMDLLDEASLLEMSLLDTVLDYPGGGWREGLWGKSRQVVRMVASDLRYVLRSKSFCPCSPVFVPFFPSLYNAFAQMASGYRGAHLRRP